MTSHTVVVHVNAWTTEGKGAWASDKKLDIKDVPHCKQESLWGLNTHTDISEDIGS